MASSFSIQLLRVRSSSTSESALRDEIRAQTESDEEAVSIMRSIERFGDDPSISRYDMTPTRPRPHIAVARVSWNVHAVR
ncbi:MAG: hypothetical protein GEU90_19165 [Gemmatimonas sp.]|nr:hypothetical protein [Gemmatimonas sp.]